MLWSIGKDSNVVIWLARKAFFNRVPFPVIQLDTAMELDEVYAYRDRYAKEWNLDLMVIDCPPESEMDPDLPPMTRAAARKSAGLIVTTAFISPYRTDRDRARTAAGSSFREIFIKADVETCESRDPKGLYKRARAGEISDFTGISAPYEEPAAPELVIDTSAQDVESCLDELVAYVKANFKTPS